MALFTHPLCKCLEFQYIYLATVAGLWGVAGGGLMPEIAQYGPYYPPLNVFTTLKRSNFLYFISSLDENE